VRDKQLLLVAAVLLIYAYVILGTVTVCWIHSEDVVSGRWVCDKDDRIKALLNQLLAFVGGYLAGKVGGKT
jgi:hypothetical protein